MLTMGERIFSRRKELGLTMEELGNKVGVQKSAVNKWEKGIVENMKQSTIVALAKALECSPVWLCGFFDDDVQAPSPAYQGKKDAELLLKIHQLNAQNRTIIETTIDAMLSNQ